MPQYPRPICSALLLAAATPALSGPLALSNTPLNVANGVAPNVMLLMDNSVSMRSILFAPGFDQGTEYPQAEYRSGRNWLTITSRTDYPLSNISNCSGGGKRFQVGRTERCVRLPDPVGSGDTLYRGNYLNYLLASYANDTAIHTAIANGTIPSSYRMEVARTVAKNLVSGTSGVRFGLAKFNYNSGGTVDAACGSASASLVSSIDALMPSTFTPLAESLYEVTRYFRGLPRHYGSGSGSYTSPIQYRCQKNFTVVVTDGLPTFDRSFPNDDPDDLADVERSLPNWDGIATATTRHDYPLYPRHADGYDTSSDVFDPPGHALFLDDIAKFAYDIDMRKGGTDGTGESFDAADFPKQNMRTYTVGFATSNRMLQDAAEYGHGRYYTANSATELGGVLQQAVAEIQRVSGSAASVASNTGFLGPDSRIYVARFDSGDWSGNLLAYTLDADRLSPTYGMLVLNPAHDEGAAWDAAAEVPAPGSRTIITRPNDTGVPFRWNSFSAPEQTAYFSGNAGYVDYIRGNGVSGMRPRSSKLGDFVNSAPIWVGAPNARYPDNLEIASYAAFRANYRDRPKMIYAGANDGMLHGFDAEDGTERLGYVPKAVLGSLRELASASYVSNHRFYVDGTPTVVDAYIGDRWRTVLAGGLNKGGQAIYALDVTDPTLFAETNAADISLWEFTDNDLGYTYSQPAIARMNDGSWAVIFGNGYNNTEPDGSASTTGNAVLYVVDAANGNLLRKIDTGVGTAQDPTGLGRPNGLATVAPVDLDGDRRIDLVYAGDLFGNLWRFDLAHKNRNLWKRDYRLFSACGAAACTASNRQSITVRPSVIRHPSGLGQIVLFGTGKYLESTDRSAGSSGLQSFYGIWDADSSALAPSGRSQLLQQSILSEQSVSFTSPDNEEIHYEVRVLSQLRPSWGTHRGWFIDLVPPSGTLQGERQVTHPVLRNGRIVFTTLIPGGDPCAPGGKGWLMEMDAASGGRLKYSPFDLNGDYRFSSADFVTVTIDDEPVLLPVSGIAIEGGAAATPSVLAAENGMEFKYLSTAGGLRVVRENPGSDDTGRQSWRQIVQ